jgi:hypothetical protein
MSFGAGCSSSAWNTKDTDSEWKFVTAETARSVYYQVSADAKDSRCPSETGNAESLGRSAVRS